MKSFMLASVLSVVLSGDVFGSGECTEGGVKINTSGEHMLCLQSKYWSKECPLGETFENLQFLCIGKKGKKNQTALIKRLLKCQKDLTTKEMELSGHECKEQSNGEWKWVKSKVDDLDQSDLGGKGKGADLSPPAKLDDTQKPSLTSLMETNKGLFEPIIWKDAPSEVAEQLKGIAKRFNCAFKLRNASKYGSYYSVFRGHGREKSYDKAVNFKKEGCPNGEIPFEDGWTPFSADKRLKHFVWNLQFKAQKDRHGNDIPINDKDSFFAQWNWGWYQLRPLPKVTQTAKPSIRSDLEWYDKGAREVEDTLESGLGDCAVGTNCRSFKVFKYKLENCNMRQLYDSRCIAWAQSSKWVLGIIDSASVDQNRNNQIMRENVIYAFIAEELLNRFDRYTYTNRKVRGVLSFIRDSQEFEGFEKMMTALVPNRDVSVKEAAGTSVESFSKITQKELDYIMKRLATPENANSLTLKK